MIFAKSGVRALNPFREKDENQRYIKLHPV